jgi:hypothetical protein
VSLKRIHQQEGALGPLVAIDHRNQTLEVFGLAVNIQCGSIRLGFDKGKMPRIFLIDKKLIGDTQRLLSGFLY